MGQTTPGASVVHLGYDDGDRLLTIAAHLRGADTSTNHVTALEYAAKVQRQRITNGNGTETTYTYINATKERRQWPCILIELRRRHEQGH